MDGSTPSFPLVTISLSLLKLMSIESMMHPIISSSVAPFSSCPQSFPASRSFPMRWLFTSSSQSIGASASAWVLPMNIEGWFPLGLTGLISFHSKGFSRALSLLYGPTFTSICDSWKNHDFDYMELCWQSDVSALSFFLYIDGIDLLQLSIQQVSFFYFF